MGVGRGEELWVNETRCVMGPARGGNFVQGGGAKCVNLCVVSPAFWMDLEFRFFFLGCRPGIFILGGHGKGGFESEGWQHRGPEGGREGCMWGGKNGLSLSLLFVFYSPPSLMCSAAPAVGRLTHSLRVTQAGV